MKKVKADKKNKKFQKEEKRLAKKQVKAEKKSAKAGKKAAKLFGKFAKATSKLDDAGLLAFQTKMNSTKWKLPASISLTMKMPRQTKKVTKKAA